MLRLEGVEGNGKGCQELSANPTGKCLPPTHIGGCPVTDMLGHEECQEEQEGRPNSSGAKVIELAPVQPTGQLGSGFKRMDRVRLLQGNIPSNDCVGLFKSLPIR